MMLLLDTNVLVYAINTSAPQHAPSRALVEAVRNKKLEAALVPQVLLEFFAVVTDKRRVEKPLDPLTAWGEVEKFQAIFKVLDPGPTAIEKLGKLVSETGVRGGNIFDAWLAAQMQACGIPTICTYNTGDFARFAVGVVTPEQVLSAQSC